MGILRQFPRVFSVFFERLCLPGLKCWEWGNDPIHKYVFNPIPPFPRFSASKFVDVRACFDVFLVDFNHRGSDKNDLPQP